MKLVDLELGQAPVGLDNVEDYDFVRGLVCADRVPIGWAEIPILEGRCSAATIARALEQQFSRYTRRLPVSETAGDGPPPSVSVAVCTRDRSDDLAVCLKSLQELDYPALELIVVDNASSTDATARLVRQFPGVRYIREPRPGLDWARNRAIAAARGEIIAFTDDDVVVDAGWVRALAEAFRSDRHVMAVTGLVVPYELETEAQLLFEQYRSFARGFDRVRAQTGGQSSASIALRYGGTGRFGTGANMAFRRRVFDLLGPFDPCLGAGTASRGGDDLEMFFRVLKCGHALIYEPRALVRHRHRRTGEQLRRQIWDHGISFSAYLVRSWLTYPEERWAFTRLGAWWIAKTIYRTVWPKAAPRGALRRLAVAELGGLAVGLTRYQRAVSAAAVEAVEEVDSELTPA